MTFQKERYHLIDGIRGLALVNMVLFHFLYDVFIIYGQDPGWYQRTGSHLWQQGICWTFILISGFSWRFGKSHSIRRGIFLNICGLIITFVTGIAVPGQTTYFGILNFLGCAVLLMALLEKPASRLPAGAAFVGSLLCFLLLRHVGSGMIGIGGLTFSFPTVSSYSSPLLSIPGILLGFPDNSFTSSDYFPLIPWFFLFAAGYFLHPLLMRRENIRSFLTHRIPLLSAAGRYSIWIYLIHQPVCMGICVLLFGSF